MVAIYKINYKSGEQRVCKSIVANIRQLMTEVEIISNQFDVKNVEVVPADKYLKEYEENYGN